MPRYCAAWGCGNSAYKRYKQKQIRTAESNGKTKIAFHLFPTDPVRKEKWIKIMKLEGKTIYKGSCLCSIHFDEKFIDRTFLVNVRLRENAIPHLDTEYDKVINETDFRPVDDLNSMGMEMVLENDNIEQHFPSDTYLTFDKETNTPPLLLQERSMKSKKIEKETSVSPERIWNSSTPKTIQEANLIAVKNLKKQIKGLERKAREKDKKILIMKNILDELKMNYIIYDNEDEMSIGN